MTTASKAMTAVGKRKSAIARVRVQPGTGQVTINERPIEKYFLDVTWREIALRPLALVGVALTNIDVAVRVSGGGLRGQAEAIRHALSRIYVRSDEATRPVLKKAGFLTRDPRVKERKKYGLKKARRAPQFSKR